MAESTAWKRVLARSPLPRAFAAATPDGLRVLAYHGVPDQRRFASQVEHLVDRYRVVSLDEVHDALHTGAPLPPRAVLITFDDGDPTVVDNALPVLADAELPAVVYVVGDLVDSDSPFWWDEAEELFAAGRRPVGAEASSPVDLVRRLKAVDDDVRRRAITSMRDGRPPARRQLTTEELRTLHRHGVAIGNHTASHPCLDRCGDETVVDEIERAHGTLSSIVGVPPDTFAYPNGNPDPRALEVLRRLGYRSVFLFDHRMQAVTGDAMALSRIRVDADADVAIFALMVSGLHPLVHHRVMRRP